MSTNGMHDRSRSSPRGVPAILGFLLISAVGCGGGGGEATDEPNAFLEQEQSVMLGPQDGFALAPTEVERVAVGSMAPDFSLESIQGETVTLSGFRGEKNVILVFYRGHW